ncbi:MAG: class I SAM-dependent methyltransferase [Pseudomonadota bacterium]
MTSSAHTAHKWDAHSAEYAQLFSPMTGHVARTMLGLVSARLPKSPAMLDIACGPGDLAVAAAELCAGQKAGSVLATDISPGMVGIAEKALAPFKPYASCAVDNGEALGLESETFDAAFSCFGIFLFKDRAAGWREAVRTLKPGGLLVTSVWRGPEHNKLARTQMEPLLSALPQRLTQPPMRAGWADIMTAEGLRDEVATAAPVTDIEIHIVDTAVALPTPEAMWHAMVGNPVTGRLIGQCDDVEKEAVGRAVIAAFEQRAGGPNRPFVLTGSCHVLVARRQT